MGLVVEAVGDIGVTRLSRWIFNCYLIHDGGGGRPVVVDAGLPGLTDDIVPIMARLGLDLRSLAGVVATHGHSDHVGGAPTLSTRSGATVHLPAPTRRYLEGVTPRTPRLVAIARIWPAVFDQPFDPHAVVGAARGAQVAGYGTSGAMRWPKDHGVDFLAEGDTLPGAPDWEVLATPGHTDDSTAFWHAKTRTLLSGDAILSVGGRAWITPETVDDSASAETAERLRHLDVAHLLPGHGRPVHGERITAAAWGPGEGPKGSTAFLVGMARCLTGRVPPRSSADGR
jgi:glyoxylase-like metal-dependent hydrolase (beta-lactamase superfamily II)